MLPKTKTERHADICKEINALYAMKNHDYGDSFSPDLHRRRNGNAPDQAWG